MDDTPHRRKVPGPKPKIWADGSQNPPFVPRAFAVASLHYAREGIGPVFGVIARAAARLAATVATGNHRIPVDRLGRGERLVPSYTRVAGWIMGLADILARSGFIAHSDPELAARLRASVPPLDWSLYLPQSAPPQATAPKAQPAPDPVALREPIPPAVEDPLATIRAELSGAQPETPPPTPGPRSALADGLIDATGFALGWTAAVIALPYGLVRAGYGHLRGEDLRKLTQSD